MTFSPTGVPTRSQFVISVGSPFTGISMAGVPTNSSVSSPLCDFPDMRTCKVSFRDCRGLSTRDVPDNRAYRSPLIRDFPVIGADVHRAVVWHPCVVLKA